MKRFMLVLSAAALIAAGCAKDAVLDNGSSAAGIQRTFDVSFAATRTTYEGAGKIAWAAGDVVRYYTADNAAVSSCTVDAAGESAKLTLTTGESDSYAVAVYGASAVTDNTSAGFTATGAVSATQNGSFDDAHLAVAVVSDLDAPGMTFQNLVSFVKFTVEDSNIKKVVLTAVNGETIATSGSLSVSLGSTVSLAAETPSSSVEVSVSSPSTVYFSVLPGTLAKGFTVRCLDSEGALVGGTSAQNPVTLAAGDMINLGTIDSRLQSKHESNAALRAIMTANGYDLSNYYELPYDITLRSFYNSGMKSNACNLTTSGTTADKFASSPLFTNSTLPVGTVIVLKEGYKYRPEGWNNYGYQNSSRPAEVFDQIVVVDQAWHDLHPYRAFNIAQADGVALTDDQQLLLRGALGIFVPKPQRSSSLEQILTSNGYDPSKYEPLFLGWNKNGYYNTTDGTNFPRLIWEPVFAPGYTKVPANTKQFAATRVIPRYEIPDGSLIVFDASAGYVYRPEGWTDMAKNASRLGNISPALVQVDDQWWNGYNYRAFNVGKSVNLDDTMFNEIFNSFAIYVPKK